MVPSYTPKVFLRQAPNRLLHSYFQTKGLLLDLPWKDFRETRIDPIHQAILALPEAQRRDIGRDFRAIWELASRRGSALLTRIAKQWDVELPTSAANRRTPYERAMSAFLEQPALFAEATTAARWEFLPRGLMEKRNGLPQIAPDTSESALADFGRLLARYYQEAQDRGEHCKVEHFAQNHLDYFFAYPADYWNTLLGYEVDGELSRRDWKPAFEVVIVYDRRAGTVEICAEGGSKVRAELGARFARAILHVDQDPAPLQEAEYNLQGLLDRNFIFNTQPGENFELVRVKSIRVRWPGIQKRYVNFDVDGRNTHLNVHDLIEEALRGVVERDRLVVVGASIQAVFSNRSVSFDLGWPSTCNLGDTPEELVLKECLKRWGIDASVR
ncbi:MAG: hypothetical protein IT167_18550 [Bryobacterales bacterium]|nr:hypothetical protein [Bryobacterales bacterium]